MLLADDRHILITLGQSATLQKYEESLVTGGIKLHSA
jgi:hypothetical protein